jgi:hypothetical protein
MTRVTQLAPGIAFPHTLGLLGFRRSVSGALLLPLLAAAPPAG